MSMGRTWKASFHSYSSTSHSGSTWGSIFPNLQTSKNHLKPVQAHQLCKHTISANETPSRYRAHLHHRLLWKAQWEVSTLSFMSSEGSLTGWMHKETTLFLYPRSPNNKRQMLIPRNQVCHSDSWISHVPPVVWTTLVILSGIALLSPLASLQKQLKSMKVFVLQ